MTIPTIIGRQTFDGLGRQLTVQVGTCTTHFHYSDGQLPPSANTLGDGRRVNFTYEPALGNQLCNISVCDEATTRITHHPIFGRPSFIEGQLGTQTFAFTKSGQPANERWDIDKASHSTHWQYSLSGLLQGFEDAKGTAHRRQYDSVGRVTKTSVGTMDTTYTYDALSRPVAFSVADPDNGRTLTTAIEYDNLGREHSRTFTVTQTSGATGEEAGSNAATPTTRIFTQTLGYSPLDQIISRSWIDGDEQGEETFEYDLRDRLVRYTANAASAPQDPYGNTLVEQRFSFNALNGHEKVISTFSDNSTDEASFIYAADNPTQVIRILHTHPSWPSEITLTYDACGRVIGDSLGRAIHWNTQNRLVEVRTRDGNCKYRYDPSGRLTDRELDGILTRDLFSADQLTHKQSGNDSVQLIGDLDALFALSKVTDGVRESILVGSDSQGSVRVEAGGTTRVRRYTPHGAQLSVADNLPFGYAGELCEPLTGWYIPDGHRPYDPALMCFLAPDSDSPFGQGGINPYAWCAGDPVNRIDPDGHSWGNILSGIGIALGLVAFAFSLPAALPAASALLSTGMATLTSGQIAALTIATLDITSLVTGAAGLALELAGQEGTTTSIMGGISLVTGLASAAGGIKLWHMRRPGLKQMALDRKLGWKPPKPHRLGSGEVMVQNTSRGVDVGFIDNYQYSNKAAMLTHSDPFRALIVGPDGKVSRAADVARDFIAPRLKELGDSIDETFVLLACWGGKNGSALEIAKELGRPVKGFMEKISLGPFIDLQGARTPMSTPMALVPYLERLKMTPNPIKAWRPMFRPAKANIFHPDGSVVPV